MEFLDSVFITTSDSSDSKNIISTFKTRTQQKLVKLNSQHLCLRTVSQVSPHPWENDIEIKCSEGEKK